MGESRLVIFRDLITHNPLHYSSTVSFLSTSISTTTYRYSFHYECRSGVWRGEERGRTEVYCDRWKGSAAVAHYQSAVYEAKLLTIRSADCRLWSAVLTALLRNEYAIEPSVWERARDNYEYRSQPSEAEYITYIYIPQFNISIDFWENVWTITIFL